MNKQKLFLSVFLSLATAGVSKAQFDDVKQADIEQLHNRTLIVIVEQPTDFVNEKLNAKRKADKQADYKNAVDAFNKNFADAVTQYWKLSTGDIQYKTLDDVNDITDKKNYAVLFCRSVTLADFSTSYQVNNGLMWWPDFKEVLHDKDFSGKITVMGIALLEKFNKSAPFYQFSLPDLFPSRADLEYGVNIANAYLNYKLNHKKTADEDMLEENQGILRDKTLLLRRDWVDKRLTKAEMDKDYPFPYMITGKDTIDRLIDSTDDKYAVAIVTPYTLAPAANGGIQYVQYAYNIEDGSILASSGIPDMPASPKSPNTNNANATKQLITKRTLLDFCMYLNDSDDSGNGSKKKGKK